MDGEVQAAQAAGLVGLLDAVDGELGGGVLLVLGDEARRLHEHAAGAAGGVEDAAVEGLDDLDEQPDDAARRVELAALLALGAWRTRRGSTRRCGRRRRSRALAGISETFLSSSLSSVLVKRL